VRMVQGELSVPLAVVDADDDYRFIVKVAVPSVAEGLASLTTPSVRLPVPIAIAAAAASSQPSVPPTVVIGRVLPVAAIATSISIRRRRPHRWIQTNRP
jgi:hypothetical protein